MNFAYITADEVGIETGGGKVTKHEYKALFEMGSVFRLERKDLQSPSPEPWCWDAQAAWKVRNFKGSLAHFYSGTFGDTVATLKKNGCKIAYTIAAHDREVSKREHEAMGMQFPYPHLVEKDLWQRYIRGYRDADVIICPGSVPADTFRRYGPEFEKKRIEIIPHGCEIPENVAPLPSQFVCGYLGSLGCDKGVRYLLEAWKRLNYTDALLCIAGKDSTTDFMKQMHQHFGGGPIWLAGWVQDISTFFSNISLYVQPSATEGFGMEVTEAMSHARPVLCSKAAGACDLVPEAMRFNPCDPRDLAYKIDEAKKKWDLQKIGLECRETAREYTWQNIRERYKAVWRSML